jgi:myo-inositol-1(or 4)-monophosphatase
MTPDQTPDSLARFEDVACSAAREAGELLRHHFVNRTPLTIESKGLHDFVTAVDREAEGVVLETIRRHFPTHEIMSEEAAPDAAAADHRWVVDPLDGTTNFIHGLPTFAVSIALEGRDGLLAAAIYQPVLDELFHAHRGGGARLNGEPIHCSEPAEPNDSLISTGFPFRELSRLPEYLKAFETMIHSSAGLRRAGSAAIDLAYTACGRHDAFWEIGLSRWDIAAGALLVTEAGGTVTDVAGGNDFLDSGDIVAAGQTMHPVVLGITRPYLG